MNDSKVQTIGHVRWINPLILGLFFSSGACGLIYEIVWARYLRMVLGNSVFAITTVLCAFMGGLALGSFISGRLIDRRRDPLRIYGLMEGGIGLYCLLLPLLVSWCEPVYRQAYLGFQGSFYTLSLIRFVFSAGLLILPTTMMGATLPILARFFVNSADGAAATIGRVYGINTLGAALGAALAGLVLLPAIGVSMTLYFTCALNMLICLAALLLHRRYGQLGQTDPGGPQAKAAEAGASAESTVSAPDLPAGQGASGGLMLFLLVGYGLSGFAAMVYEVAWTRLLSLVIGSTVYAFSLMLVAFILGLGLGSLAYSWVLDRRKNAVGLLAAIEVGIGLSALAIVPILGRLPVWIVPVINAYPNSFWMIQTLEFGIIFALMLLPTTLMGAAFPLASRLYAGNAAKIGRSIGNLYSANTLGSILGSFAGGFILVPLLGIQRTAVSAVLLNVLLGCGFLAFVKAWRVRGRLAAGAAVLAVTGGAIALLPAWDRAVLASGPYRNYAELAHPGNSAMSKSKILFYEEGIGTTVTVTDLAGVRTLVVNGKADASTGSDMSTQKLLAHVPMLLHPAPKDVLVIGLGSGVTVGSACRYGADRLDCVEICPSVIKASRLFDDVSGNPMADPRVKVIVEDGRNHLLLSRQKYDVIISEPSNPYIAGIADLFTQDFYRICRDRLKPGGIVCAWCHTYSLRPEAFRSIVATFISVFPNMTVWESSLGDYLLIGTAEPLKVDVSDLAKRMNRPEIAEDLRKIGLSSLPDFLSNVVMEGDGASAFAAGAKLHTDDNALLEFSAPQGLYSSQSGTATLLEFNKFRSGKFCFLTHQSQEPESMGQAIKTAARYVEARRHAVGLLGAPIDAAAGEWKTVFALNPSEPRLLDMFSFSLGKAREFLVAGKDNQARRVAEMLLSINPADPEGNATMATLMAREGKIDTADEYMSRAVRLDPQSHKARFLYAQWLTERQKLPAAQEQFEAAANLEPQDWSSRLKLADVCSRQGKEDQALAALAQACQIAPDNALCHAAYAQALDRAKQEALSIEQYRIAYKLNPAPDVANNLAWLLAVTRDEGLCNPAEAIALAEKLPPQAGALDTLAAGYARAGKFAQAVATAEKALGLATHAGNAELAKEIQNHLQLYRQGRSFMKD